MLVTFQRVSRGLVENRRELPQGDGRFIPDNAAQAGGIAERDVFRPEVEHFRRDRAAVSQQELRASGRVHIAPPQSQIANGENPFLSQRRETDVPLGINSSQLTGKRFAADRTGKRRSIFRPSRKGRDCHKADRQQKKGSHHRWKIGR